MSGTVGKNAGRASGIVGAGDIGADAVDSANIADDAIDSEHYTNASIDNAHIADNAVGLDEMAGGTDGNIISYDASGDPVAIATGNDGQVLTSAGAGAPPVFEDAGGGGSWNVVGTAVADDSATLTVTGIDDTYAVYAFAWSDILPANDGEKFQMRMGDSGGIDTGASDYWGAMHGQKEATSARQADQDESRDYMNLTFSDVGNASGEGCSGYGFLCRSTTGNMKPSFSGNVNWQMTDGTHQAATFHGGRNADIDIDRLLIRIGVGNITSGRFTVWGIAHA